MTTYVQPIATKHSSYMVIKNDAAFVQTAVLGLAGAANLLTKFELKFSKRVY